MNIDLGGLPPASEDETINTVQWVIVDATFTPVAGGFINVSQPGSTASFEKFGLVPGVYGVQLTASSEELSRDGQTPRTNCEGTAGPFTVNPDAQTAGTVLLNCGSQRELGSLRINGEFNRCSIVQNATVSPLVVSTGFFIDVAAMAQDDEGDAVEYEWRSASGEFTDANAATTQYKCLEIGIHSITIAVSDDAAQDPFDNFPVPTPAPAFTYCEDTWTTQVTCIAPPTCPNGVIDEGEDCDLGPPPAADNPAWFECDPASCLRIASCGDGIVDTGAGEDCDPCSDPVGGCDPGAAGYVDGMPTTDPFCSSNCQDVDVCNPGTTCEDGSDCADVSECTDGSAECISRPPCDDGDACTVDLCTPDANNEAVCDNTGQQPDGTSCDTCGANTCACIGGGCEVVPDPDTSTVAMVCANSVDGTATSYLPNILVTTPLGPVLNGTDVDLSHTGTAFFPATFLNAALAFGFTSASLQELNATVTVRSGAAGGPVLLSSCSGQDQDGNALECPRDVVIPSTCSDGSTCNVLTDPCDPVTDCQARVNMELGLNTASDTYTPNGGAGGEILIGWDEDAALVAALPFQQTQGTTGPNGIRLGIGLPIPVAMECSQGECEDGNGCADAEAARLLLDPELQSIPISGGAATCEDTLPGQWEGTIVQLDSGQPFLTTQAETNFTACAPEGSVVGTFIEHLGSGTCNDDGVTLCHPDAENAGTHNVCGGDPCIPASPLWTCTGNYILDGNNWPVLTGTFDVTGGTGTNTGTNVTNVCLDLCTGTVTYDALTDTLEFVSAEGECPTFLTSSSSATFSPLWADVDGDGVHDRIDNCLYQPGTLENQGCPEPL